jgi:transposase
VKLISQSSRKDDKLDAQMLARLARVDPQLLRPIRHRSEQAQLHLTQIRVRASLVEGRTSLVNRARGLAKALGERLPPAANPWGGAFDRANVRIDGGRCSALSKEP